MDMKEPCRNGLAMVARQKLETGALLTLEEVAAMFDVVPATVHRLPLRSIRLGRQYRFDPKDVRMLIEPRAEALAA